MSKNLEDLTKTMKNLKKWLSASLLLSILSFFLFFGCEKQEVTVADKAKSNAVLSVEPGYFEKSGNPALDTINKVHESLNVQDDELVIYYYRADKDYEPWALWIWALDGGDGSIAWPNSQNWTVQNDVGYMRFKKDGSNANGSKLVDSKGMTGLIARQDSGWTKDGEADRQWNTNASNAVIILSGDQDLYFPTEFKVKIKSAKLVSEKTIELELNTKYGLDTKKGSNSGFVVQSEDGTKTYAVSKVYNSEYPKNQKNNFTDKVSIELKDSVNPSASLQVLKEGFEAPAKVNTQDFAVIFAEKTVPDKNEVLGCVYDSVSKKATFKVWAPTSSNAKVLIYKTGNAKDPEFEVPMTLNKKTGVWSATFNKQDVDGWFYAYELTNAKGSPKALDPYAKSMAAFNEKTDGVGRAAIVDLKSSKAEPKGGWAENQYINLSKKEDAIIYEVHIRDFTISEDSNVNAQKGTYSAFVEKLPYLKSLGVTHIQLMPVLNFFYGDENNKTFEDAGTSSGNNYNWGYDPHNYFTPEGWYSSNPADPYARISELKTLINEAHKQGLAVILDVVYNHMANTTILEQVVPDYFFRRSPTGAYLSNSGCGNDVESTRIMARKLIVDSTRYWVEEFKIDGFRFDLMGLIDSETMLNSYESCKSVNPSVLFIGEGWKMYNGPKGTVALDQNYMQKTDDIAVFNDELRDAIKAGGYNENGLGFITNSAAIYNVKFFNNLTGRPKSNYQADDPGDNVQYLVCHDGLTLHDAVVNNAKIDESTPSGKAEAIRRIKMGNFLGLTSQGIAFLHAGQERGRTKPKLNATSETLGNFVRNSYDSSDNINQFIWTIDEDYQNLLEYTKGLISIRKTFDVFRFATAQEVENATEMLPDSDGFLFGYTIKDSDGTWALLLNADKRKPLTIDTGLNLANVEVYADENTAQTTPIANVSGVTFEGSKAILSPLSAILLKAK